VIGAAVLGGATLAGGLGSLYQVTANDAAQRENRKRLAELERMRDAGDLGLSPLERRQLQSQLFTPMSRAAAQGRAASEQQMAAMGSTAAAGDYARIREAEARQNAAAQRDAAMTVQAMDEQKKQSRLAEIEGRIQAKSQYKADDIATLFGGLTKTGAAAGAIAGSGPGVLPGTLLSVGGFKVPGQQTPGFSPDEIAMLQRLKASGKLDSVLAQAQALQGGM